MQLVVMVGSQYQHRVQASASHIARHVDACEERRDNEQ